MMRCLSLFSGIGGLDLAAEAAGMQTIAFCERDEFCRRVLAAHWPGVPIYDDICTLDAGRLRADGLGAIDLIHGGFPCQDISNAGKRAGIDGERSGLWREFARLIGEVRPRYVVVENVAALLVRGLDRVLGDLAEIGYDAEWTCLRAADVGAPHKRERIFIVAYRNGEYAGLQPLAESGRRVAPLAGGDGASRPLADADRAKWRPLAARGCDADRDAAGRAEAAGRPRLCGAPLGGVGQADAAGAGRPGARAGEERPGRAGPTECGEGDRAGVAQSGLGDAVDGLPRWLARWPAYAGQVQHEWEAPRVVTRRIAERGRKLKALGNAVVPAQAYPVFAAIAAAEAGE